MSHIWATDCQLMMAGKASIRQDHCLLNLRNLSLSWLRRIMVPCLLLRQGNYVMNFIISLFLRVFFLSTTFSYQISYCCWRLFSFCYSFLCRRERQFKVAIKFASKANIHHLRQFLSGRQLDAPQETIQVLDIVLRESPSEKYSIFAVLWSVLN